MLAQVYEEVSIIRAAFPTAGTLDTFTRANQSPITTPYSQPMLSGNGSILLISNHLIGNTTGANSCYKSDTTYGPDMEAGLTLLLYGGNNGFQTLVRVQSPNSAGATDGYGCEMVLGGTQGLRIREYVNDTPATLGSQTNQTLDSGDSCGIDSVGTTHGAYFNNDGAGWSQLQTQSDATVNAAGNIGIIMNSNSNTGDDLVGGTVISSGAPVGYFRRRQLQ
jgi:hypothetical protein